jgi:hypothetical protein
MKKIFVFLTFVILFSVNIKAQSTSNDTSLSKAAVSVCDCLTKANIDEKSTPEQMQQTFLSCMFTAAPDLITKIVSSGEDYQKAGQEIGTQLAMEMMKNNCPAFTKIAAAMSGGINDTMQMEMPMQMQSKVGAAQSIDGTVIKVEEKDFTYITIKTTAGRELTCIYYEYVPGSDDWIKDATARLKNKNVSLSYVETEVYQPKFKQFMNIREIKTLTIK